MRGMAALARQRALIALTNTATYADGEPTGCWASEFAHLYMPFVALGLAVDLVSPEGGPVPLDPVSLRWPFFDRETRALLRRADVRADLANTLAAEAVDSAPYALIAYAGGHGAMFDFRESMGLVRLAEEIYAQGGIVSAVCHGVAGLLPLSTSAGVSLISGRTVTGYSALEERLAGRRGQVPYLLPEELRGCGANYESAWLPFTPYAVRDERITTGQNPQSTRALARLNVDLLRAGVAGRLELP